MIGPRRSGPVPRPAARRAGPPAGAGPPAPRPGATRNRLGSSGAAGCWPRRTAADRAGPLPRRWRPRPGRTWCGRQRSLSAEPRPGVMGFHCPLNTNPKLALGLRAQPRLHGNGPGVRHTWTMADEPGPEREQTGLGGYIRLQRQLPDLSLRQLADLTKVSNAYLSQVERGLHQPSLRVLRSIADALNLSADTLLTKAGMASARDRENGAVSGTEAAIHADPELGPEERETLLRVYRSLRRSRDT